MNTKILVGLFLIVGIGFGFWSASIYVSYWGLETKSDGVICASIFFAATLIYYASTWGAKKDASSDETAILLLISFMLTLLGAFGIGNAVVMLLPVSAPVAGIISVTIGVVAFLIPMGIILYQLDKKI